MRTIRIIRELWLLGNAGLLASLVFHPPTTIIVQGIADLLLAVAWIAVIYRACASREWKWAVVMAVWPLAVWVYIFWHHDEVAQPGPAPGTEAAPPDLADPPRVSSKPLALRQALEAVEEAERRYPGW